MMDVKTAKCKDLVGVTAMTRRRLLNVREDQLDRYTPVKIVSTHRGMFCVSGQGKDCEGRPKQVMIRQVRREDLA